MPEIDYNADELANELMVSLLATEDLDVTFDPLPEYDFGFFDADNPIFQSITRLSVDELTEVDTEGDGVFDKLMRAMKGHLRLEYDAGRIAGAEYAKAYVEMSLGVMTNAVQFLLGKDQAFWAAANAQISAANNLTELAIAQMKYKVAQIEVKQGRAAFALTKLKLATEAHGVGIAKFQIQEMLPAQLLMVEEQIEQTRAQTMDTRTDGTTPVTGQIGKQKELYDQQITSYQRDVEIKIGKLFSDAWITQKTLDEGLSAPAQFVNAEIDEVLIALRANAGL